MLHVAMKVCDCLDIHSHRTVVLEDGAFVQTDLFEIFRIDAHTFSFSLKFARVGDPGNVVLVPNDDIWLGANRDI